MKYLIDYLSSENGRTQLDEPLSAPNLVFRSDGREMMGLDCNGQPVICNIAALRGKSQSEVNLPQLKKLGANATNNLEQLGNEPITFHPVNIHGAGVTFLFTRQSVKSASDVLGYTDARLSLSELQLAVRAHNEHVNTLEHLHHDELKGPSL